MASPHPSVTSLHNSPHTLQTPADYPHILPDSLVDFALDFAHLETGQYENSPNAWWKLTSKTVPCDPIAAKRREEKTNDVAMPHAHARTPPNTILFLFPFPRSKTVHPPCRLNIGINQGRQGHSYSKKPTHWPTVLLKENR